jgi:hypothetical protein
MDVSNLIPPTQPPRSEGAEKRTRELGLPPPATLAAETAARAAATGRPAVAGKALGDRIERSPEFEQQLAGYKDQLGQQTAMRKEEVAALRQEIAETMDASHETLIRAALGILHGELYFLAGTGS